MRAGWWRPLPLEGQDKSWMLTPEDIASMVLHLLSYPPNALPSLVEMRPSKPPGK